MTDGLRHRVCLIAQPAAAGANNGVHVRAHYFTPQTCHRAMAVTGRSCLAAASRMPGTVAHDLAVGLDGLDPKPAKRAVGVGNPAGVLRAIIHGTRTGEEIAISSAAYVRGARIPIRGHTPIDHAAPASIARSIARVRHPRPRPTLE